MSDGLTIDALSDSDHRCQPDDGDTQAEDALPLLLPPATPTA